MCLKAAEKFSVPRTILECDGATLKGQPTADNRESVLNVMSSSNYRRQA